MKVLSEKDILKKARKSIGSLLSDISFINLLETRSKVRIDNKQVDLVLNTLVSGKPAKFFIEIKSQGEPRLVRLAIAQLKGYLKDRKDSYGILVAPYLSDASRQICKEAGVGCIDLAGNAFLSFKSIYVDKSGTPNPFAVSRISKSVFSPKSSRILRVLLSVPSKRWYVEDMSREAGISIGLTSRVKQALLAQEWIKEENKSFFLIKLEEVLDQWVSNYSYQKNLGFSFYSGLGDEELETAVKKECKKRGYRYGLALFSGARKVAPFVRFMKFFSYIEGNIEEIATSLQLKKVESGANVILLRPYDEGVFYGLQNVSGIFVVSDIQLYLDLKSYKGRGEEAAQAILEERIKPKR
ncbi:MAG: type IV toxin-antitoxin system AbiEi family antitoxin [Candidatus Eisenbacteria bacterium]|nr:type IV toxin-antitoxin system AbiEi family antitoxin [Candidatus Eisenbacteria bacterium]